DHVDPGRDVRVQVDAVDEALADLLLEVPVVELATQRTFEHLLRAGLFEHRAQVAAQLQLRELLVATALARDADAPCPGRALDPVQALAHAHREARERADAGLVDDAVAVGHGDERQLAQRRAAGRHALDVERYELDRLAGPVEHDARAGVRRIRGVRRAGRRLGLFLPRGVVRRLVLRRRSSGSGRRGLVGRWRLV